MSNVTRLSMIVAMCVGLPACSSNMTRFDYPVLGMNEGPAPESKKQTQFDKTYGQNDYKARNDYRSSDYQQPDYRQSQYKQDDYSRPDYRQSYDRKSFNQDYKSEYSTRRQSYKQYADNRDVYDTKGLDKRGMQREELPALNEQQRREPTYRYVPRKESTYQPVQQTQRSERVSSTGQHVVVEGDTLYNISKRYDVTTSEIRSANLMDGNDIKLGQRLKIPGLKKSSAGQYAKIDTGTETTLKAGSTYRVQRGDTVYNIARRAGVKPGDLAEANGLSDVSSVNLGQELTIPGKNRIEKPVRVASIDRKAGLKKAQSRKAPVPVRKKLVSRNKIKSVDSGARQRLTGGQRFMWPVGGRILSKFGRQKSGTINDGVNLSVPAGTKVKAAEGGVVAYAGNELKGYGNLVLVRHKNNWVSAYAHNSKLLVKRGDKVRRGQVIAKSGKTGSVHQPQLHFELRKGSKPVNPMKYLAMR